MKYSEAKEITESYQSNYYTPKHVTKEQMAQLINDFHTSRGFASSRSERLKYVLDNFMKQNPTANRALVYKDLTAGLE